MGVVATPQDKRRAFCAAMVSNGPDGVFFCNATVLMRADPKTGMTVITPDPNRIFQSPS
jgi:hypothetical protein